MAANPGDYDDASEDGSAGPLLPPDDRLWRHPSEVGNGTRFALDAAAVRSRWVASAPSRGSTWTAGLVGALLATGLVVMGTHLMSTALSGEQHAAAPGVKTTAPSRALSSTLAQAPRAGGLGRDEIAAVERVGRAVVVVEAASPLGSVKCLGVVIGPDGTLLTAAIALKGATSVLVTLPGTDVPSVGIIEGTDPSTGLAVLRVNGEQGLPTVTISTGPTPAGEVALAVTAPGGATYSLGSLSAGPPAGGTATVAALATDLPSGADPPGSPIIDSRGQIVALTTGSIGGNAVAEPAWLVAPVAEQLSTAGIVRHGWLGIRATTEPALSAETPAGVRVLAVDAHSAAAKANLAPGDVVVSLDGRRLTSMSQLQGRLYVLDPGSVITLGVVHDHTHRTVRVTLGNQ